MTIEDLKAKLHEHIDTADNRLIRMLYALVHVYESEVQDEKPTLHSYEAGDTGNERTNNDV